MLWPRLFMGCSIFFEKTSCCRFCFSYIYVPFLILFIEDISLLILILLHSWISAPLGSGNRKQVYSSLYLWVWLQHEGKNHLIDSLLFFFLIILESYTHVYFHFCCIMKRIVLYFLVVNRFMMISSMFREN